MKRLILLATATTIIAACGGGVDGERKALVAQCQAEGESQETCECTVDAMADNLSPELFKKVAAAAKAGNEDAMDSLTSAEQMEFLTVMPALAKCMSPELGKMMEELNDGN